MLAADDQGALYDQLGAAEQRLECLRVDRLRDAPVEARPHVRSGVGRGGVPGACVDAQAPLARPLRDLPLPVEHDQLVAAHLGHLDVNQSEVEFLRVLLEHLEAAVTVALE